MITMQQQSFIYKLLLSPKFRILRYGLLFTFFVIVSLNQALVGYKYIMPLMGNNVYWIVIVTILVYIISVFFIMRRIMRYLLSNKYIKLVFSIVLCALLFTLVPNIVYFVYVDNYDLLSSNVIIDNLSAYTIYLLCISGVIIPIFLRNWLISKQELNQLKQKQEQSEVEHLKEQINPSAFFKILHQSSILVKEQPAKASAMLMKLSQLLRYQLYDCNRNQVLLTAEISFLRNFLELESLYSPNFSYSLEVRGNANTIFIPPSILLPYVQCIINTLDSQTESPTVDIIIDVNDKDISFGTQIRGMHNIILLKKELLSIKERLERLYKDQYSLSVTKGDNNETETETNLKLYKDIIYGSGK